MGKQNDTGALQDLLRRVQEIDSEITNTPIEEFKPNVSSFFISRMTVLLLV